MNRLAQSASPYLRQHAENPVHWVEWSDEAFARARERDVPVLLSVGYAACHWCHVMAHESFEDPRLAAQMNDGFVCIKVDREERPDIDAVYMAATVAMTGQGGWPMTCFLTPEGEPFYCGTYFPPEPRGGMPGFGQLLAAIGDTWRNRRDEVFQASGSITEHLRANTGAVPPGPVIDPALLAGAVSALCDDEDRRAGGFGGAPKFPPAAQLEALLRADEFGVNENALGVVERACSAMARGGIYDQLAGGFARYAVDADWVVPHFEKMLYDNALLLRTYAHLARRLSIGSRGEGELATRITEETVAFLDGALWTGQGYASSLDADTDGVEGLTYVWTPAQLHEILGDDDGRWAATLFIVTDGGTFENGASTLQLPSDPDDPDRFASVRARLLAARNRRPQPARDDKVVLAWNALTITALVEAGVALDRPDWIARAAEAAEALLRTHVVETVVSTRSARSTIEGGATGSTIEGDASGSTVEGGGSRSTVEGGGSDSVVEPGDEGAGVETTPRKRGELRRSSLGGTVGEPRAALDDHAAFVTALLSLHQVTGELRWRDDALRILDLAIERFADPQAPGAWFDAPEGSLITRPRDPVDGATPAGASLMAEALLTAISLAPEEYSARYAELADQTLARAGLILQKMPRSAGHWLTVALARLAGPLQVGVAQTPDSDGALAAQVRGRAPGGTVVVAGSRDTLPLLTDRGPVGGVDAAYVCRGNVCGLPVTTADVLAFD